MLVCGRRLLTALLQAQRWPFQPSRDMRLVQLQAPPLPGPRAGRASGGGGGGKRLGGHDPPPPKTVLEFLEQGEAAVSVARR